MFSNNGYYGQYKHLGGSTKPFLPDSGEKVPYENQVIMPQPTGLPWNVQSMPWGNRCPPTLVEFTAQPPQEPQSSCPFAPKRKHEPEPTLPHKLPKMDEMMAAHLNGLHISANFTPHGNRAEPSADDGEDEGFGDAPSSADRLAYSHDLNEFARGAKIVLSDVMKSFKEEPILPQSIIDRLEKPCMSLVLWKPPGKNDAANNSRSNDKDKRSTCSNSKRSVLVPDLNAMDTL